jgi:hypothetical protein
VLRARRSYTLQEHKGVFRHAHKETHMSTDSFSFTQAAMPLDDELAEQSLDKRIIGEMNRLKICRFIFKFGWLTSRMVAALVFEHASQAWPMARRTLKSMLDDGTLIKRPIPQSGVDAYLLSAKGARFLSTHDGVDANSGQSLALGNPIHRACSNWYLINALQQKWEVFTEHEIATDKSPVRVLDGKTADGILLGEGEAIWLECENAFKNVQSRQTIVSHCAKYLDRETMVMVTPDCPLRQMTIVATNPDALRHIKASFHSAFRGQTIREAQLQLVNVCLLPVSRSLVPGDQVDGNLWFDLMEPTL